METKHEPLLLSVFLSNHLSGNSPLTESSVSKSIKWCPSCASPLIILLEKIGEKSTDAQFPVRALPEAMCSGEEGNNDERDAILTGGWYCRNCGLHMLPFAPSVTTEPEPVASDKQMPFTDSLELIDEGYKSLETQVMSSCGQLLDHIRQAVSVKVRLLDDSWKDMNEREARLRTLDRDLSGRVHGLAVSEQRYQERLMKLNDYRDSLMRSIQIQLSDIRRREENLTRENQLKESTENQMVMNTKPCGTFLSKTPERKVELSSEQKTDCSFPQRTPNEGSLNLVKKERFAQEKFPESQDREAAAEKSTEDKFKIINNSNSCKSVLDERFGGRAPKFRELLKNFEEQSSPERNGFQRRFSQKNSAWKNESYEVWDRKESGNSALYRDFALRTEDSKAIGINEAHELRNREPVHKANLIGGINNVQGINRSFNTLSQTKTWLKSPQDIQTETRQQNTQKHINSTILNDSQGSMLARVSKASIHSDLQKLSSSAPWPQNSTEQHFSSLATVSEHKTPESYYPTYSNSLETSAFQSKLYNSDQLSNRKSQHNVKTDFDVHNFDQPISRVAQVYGSKVQQVKSLNSSQKIDQSDKSTWAIRPRAHMEEINGSHIRARSHSPKAFLDRHRFYATSNNDFATQIQPSRETTDRKSNSYL